MNALEKILEDAKKLTWLYEALQESLPAKNLLLKQRFSSSKSKFINGQEWVLHYYYGYSNSLSVSLGTRSLDEEGTAIDLVHNSLESIKGSLEEKGLIEPSVESALYNFIAKALLEIKKEMETQYYQYFEHLPPDAKALSRRMQNLANKAQKKMECLKDELSKRDEELKKFLDLRNMLHGLQQTIEREARNLYNTRTFLAGSKTIKGIRERLMGAISEEALGENSIYHDHEPPEDLMPKQKKPVPMPKGPVHTLAKM